MSNKFGGWNPPEEELEDFPDWMLPPHKRRNYTPKQKLNENRFASKGLGSTIEDILKQPPLKDHGNIDLKPIKK